MEVRFSTLLWEHPGDAAWHFVTVPEELSDDVREITGGAPRRGFGSVRVEVTIGSSTWSTSVFPDKGTGCYVLPVKKQVRSRESIEAGDEVEVGLRILDAAM